MCDGVFMTSTYRCLSESLVFRDAPEESVGNRAVEDGSPDHEPRRANKPENICESAGSIKLCLDFRRGHIAGKLIDVESDGGGYAQDGCRFCNQWCPHEAATKLLLFALPCGRNRRACGEFGRRPENRKFVLNEAEGCGILCQKRVQIPLKCPAVRAAEFTEVCDWDDFRRYRRAEQSRAKVGAQSVCTRASLISIVGRCVEPYECGRCSRSLTLLLKPAKWRQVRQVDVTWAAPGKTVPGQGTQAVDQGDGPAKNEKATA
jgi:hypothetical protein